jgi:sulfur-oxidizing protein SoxA
MLKITGIVGALAILAAASSAALAQGWDLSRYSVEDRRSGYFFLGEQTRALQDDDFINPGMFAVDHGRALWNMEVGEAGKSCASCHGDAADSMRGVSTRYPKFDLGRNGIINLELRINEERVHHMMAPPLEYESKELLALTAFIANQSRGMALDVEINGPATPFFKLGKDFYFQRRGQLDLACSQCHDNLDGMMLRGDRMSQGQITGFPFFRLIWNSMGSTHRMFEWCNTSMRAEPYPLGSDEYLNLELYVAWRGRGLPVETPAVRR